MKRLRGYATIALLLGVGLALVWNIWAPRRDVFTTVALALAAALAALPLPRRAVLALLQRIGEVRPWIMTVVLFVLALLELGHSASANRAYHGAKTFDEQSYTLGTLLLASGRVAAPSPEAPESFESFFVLTEPAYGSIYGPGTALLHVPAAWLGVPLWMMSVLLSAAVIPAAFLALRPVLGRELAPCAALLLLGATQLRAYQAVVMSQVPALLIGLSLFAAAWWYRAFPSRWRALLVGGLSGLLIITRPQDAACILPAILIAVVPSWRPFKCPPGVHFMWVFAGVLPAVLLSMAHNHALTGSVLTTPYWTYTQAAQPGTGFLDHVASTQPHTVIQQKIDYNESFGGQARKLWASHFWRGIVLYRTALTFSGALPTIGLAILFPLGIWGLVRTFAGRMLLVPLGFFVLLYGSFTFFLPHYILPFAGCMVAVVLAAPLAVGHLAPKLEPVARALVVLIAWATLLSALPEINADAKDPVIVAPSLQLADAMEATLPQRPAIVLFEYHTGMSFAEEPVYNLRHWDIDAHEVIRAHDLGPLNQRLFDSYARKSPLRYVYRFNPSTGHVTPLGRVDELAEKPRP